MMRSVIDTNVIISGLINTQRVYTHAPSARLLDAVFRGGPFIPVTTEPLLAELRDALGHRKPRRAHGLNDSEIREFVAL